MKKNASLILSSICNEGACNTIDSTQKSIFQYDKPFKSRKAVTDTRLNELDMLGYEQKQSWSPRLQKQIDELRKSIVEAEEPDVNYTLFKRNNKQSTNSAAESWTPH